MRKRQRGFKKAPQKFFYKEDIFLSRMASILKTPQSKVKGFFYQHTLSAIKLNGIKKEQIEKKGFKLKEVEWSKATYLVLNESEKRIKKLPEYSQGLIHVFNLAEIIPIVSLNPNPNDIILDMYPQQTTLYLSSIMKNKGSIIANIDNENEAEDLERIFSKYGIKNIELNFGKGEDLDKKFANSFDKIVLKSPNSREGIISFSKKRPLKNWSIKKTKALSKLQEKLISTAFKCLKRGGLLIYFTTTISPNENEEIVSKLLENNKDAILEDMKLLEDKNFEEYKILTKKALKEWNNNTFHPDITKTIRTIPGKTMLGTYIALIRKV